MATIRVIKESGNFVTVHRNFIQDENLSWKAKGILLYLLSRPDDWQFYESEMLKHCVDGRDSLNSGIKELEKRGYVSRERNRNEKGHLKAYEYTVRENPSHIGKRHVGFPNVGGPDTTNNNSTNNKNTNNYYNNDFDISSHNISNRQQTNSSDVRDDDEPFIQIFDKINQYEINPNHNLVQSLNMKSNQIDLGIILWAIDTGYSKGIKNPASYILAIVNKKINQGVKTIEQHQQQESEYKTKNSNPNQFMSDDERQERIAAAERISNKESDFEKMLANQSENPFSDFDVD